MAVDPGIVAEEPGTAKEAARVLHEAQSYQQALQDRVKHLKSIHQLHSVQASTISSYFSFSIHPVPCRECNIASIIGMRYKCQTCLEFNLCEPCRRLTSHEHEEFVEIPFEGGHEGVVCCLCGKRPLMGVRYHCAICPRNFDLCHECKVTSRHIHNTWRVVPPIRYDLDAFIVGGRTTFRIGEQIVIMIVIRNLSQVTSEYLSFRVAQGRLPFDCPLDYKCSVASGASERCLLTGTINDEPGEYVATLRMFLPEFEEVVSGEVRVAIKVVSAGVIPNSNRLMGF